MRLIVGLGNYGKDYSRNRHNAGFLMIDFLAQARGASWRSKDDCLVAQIDDARLVKLQSFMNNSGEALRRFLSVYKKEFSFDPHRQFLLLHDDLDFPLGEFKLTFGKGPKLHKGVASVEAAVRTKDFWRLRLGVDGRGGTGPDGEIYVLQDFKQDERRRLGELCRQKIVPQIKNWLLKS